MGQVCSKIIESKSQQQKSKPHRMPTCAQQLQYADT